MAVDVRPYDPAEDRDALWDLKRAFERGLGTDTGDEAKTRAYQQKLTDDYRDGYLAWVDRCVAEELGAVTLAAAGGEAVGYVFVLPDSLSYVWDAAVLNELFVRDSRRGTGVADDLMAAALAVAREQDLPLDRLILDVDAGNERARAFYRRHGFEPWGEMVAREI